MIKNVLGVKYIFLNIKSYKLDENYHFHCGYINIFLIVFFLETVRKIEYIFSSRLFFINIFIHLHNLNYLKY